MKSKQRPRWLEWLKNAGLLVGGCAVLTLFSLLLSYVNLDKAVFSGYFEHWIIPLVNFALILAVGCFLCALAGRLWIGYALTCLVVLGVCIGNYYLVLLRNDPLQWEDLFCLREALAITHTQHYSLALNLRIVGAVLAAVGLTVLFAFLSRRRLRFSWPRLVLVLVALAVLLGAFTLCSSSSVWQSMKHYEHINTWSVTEIYLSRGVPYSFARTALTGAGAPEGYRKAEAEAALAAYIPADIPADRQVDVFVVMRESYADLSDLESTPGAIDWSCYDLYHALAAESMTGTLITNGFGGNTKNAERCFLTGNYTIRDWRSLTNSYVWYLREQGYNPEGAHPFDGWFYNRQNINAYLGFGRYLFRETFDPIVGEENIADDEVLYDVILQQYAERDQTRPYFHFSVTYEGHGPYNYRRDEYPGKYVLTGQDTADGLAMDNYLGCVAHRDAALTAFVDELRKSDRPIVLLTYGDHKATLGADVNNYTTSAYGAYGMDMDLSSEEGFVNYYGTEYLIWANDAAKRQLGLDLAGKTGPTISPCYLMNVLFDALGWGEGPAYLQFMGEMMARFPVITTNGRMSVNGVLATSVSGAENIKTYQLLRKVCYFWQKEYQQNLT